MEVIIEEIKKLNHPVFYETGGNTEFISKNIFDLTGYFSEEFIVNRDLFPGLINPEDYIETNFRVKNWHKDGEKGILVMAFRLRTANGETIWFEDHLAGRKTNDKKYMQGIMIDITDVKEEETFLAQKKHQLLSSNKINDLEIEKINKKLNEFENMKSERINVVSSILNHLEKNQLNFRDLSLDFLTSK